MTPKAKPPGKKLVVEVDVDKLMEDEKYVKLQEKSASNYWEFATKNKTEVFNAILAGVILLTSLQFIREKGKRLKANEEVKQLTEQLSQLKKEIETGQQVSVSDQELGRRALESVQSAGIATVNKKKVSDAAVSAVGQSIRASLQSPTASTASPSPSSAKMF